MSAEIGTTPATDKLPTGDCAFAYFSPLGVMLRVEASHPRLIEAVAAACRGWEAPADPQGPTLHLSLKVGPVPVDDTGPLVDTVGLRLSISGDVEAHADAGHGQARCRVANVGAFEDPAFREQVLDCLILWLLTRNGRTPIHASGFVVGPTAILLAGRSGSGKSCLALAAHSAGFPLLSDDTVYLETGRRLRVWGIPRPVHLFPEDAPQLPGAAIRLRNGKRKRAIALPAPPQPVTADAATLCVLHRGDRASLEWLDPATAIAALGPLEPGFDLLATEIEAGLCRITRRGAWRLTLSAEPKEAIALLAANLPRLIEHASS
ncbi:hypothetical protein [Sphingomonas sp. Root241]|uniref:hypothetical protein n=1 Tax=Sphingomonas sp. Root241 TaxID=1736501 RepID=UPI000B13EB43|nr:hypothetical protein [Sphingomonas sp. Root241]